MVQHHINKEMCTLSVVFPLFCSVPVHSNVNVQKGIGSIQFYILHVSYVLSLHDYAAVEKWHKIEWTVSEESKH
jgi:hypothetical protein